MTLRRPLAVRSRGLACRCLGDVTATISNLFRNRRKYTTSLVASVSAMYSASVLEIATLFCFLDSHDMAPFDNLNMKPVLDFLSSISPSQSESAYPYRLDHHQYL